jgi:hypothetical protein
MSCQGGALDVKVQDQIETYISAQPTGKSDELRELHRRILAISPACKLWFLDGRNSENKVVSNPSIGYGSVDMRYANGDIREFYRVGLSANSAGISAYVMGLDDKKFLSDTYGETLGKAKITGYCLKFRSTKDINLEVFEEIVANAMGGPAIAAT